MLQRRQFIQTLAFAGLASTTVPSSLWAGKQSQAQTFRFDKAGSFTIMQITDIHQDKVKVQERSLAVLRKGLAIHKPDLVVFTGDMTTGANKKATWEAQLKPFIDAIADTKTHFAVAFGNHDSEHKGDDRWTRKEQYDLYNKHSRGYFVDYDVPVLTGCGNGVIPILDQAGRQARYNIFLMDSGAYSSKGGYDGCYSDQIAWYEKVSGTTPAVWFQHIIVPEIRASGLLKRVNKDAVRAIGMAGQHYKLNAEHTAGIIKEQLCYSHIAAYEDAEHTYQGRTLYQSWQKMRNIRGVYFGHDHMNSFEGVDNNGIRVGYTKALTVDVYNDGDPGLRIVKIFEDGSLRTDTVSERHPFGTGHLNPLPSGQIRLMSFNAQRCDNGLVRVAEAIREENPDYVALQELDINTNRGKKLDQLKEISDLTGLHGCYAKAIDFDGGTYGNAVLSRERPLWVEAIPLPGREDRVLMVVDFVDFTLMNTELDSSVESKKASLPLILQAVESAVRRRPNVPVLFAGTCGFQDAGTALVQAYGEHFQSVPNGDQPDTPSDKPTTRATYIGIAKQTAPYASFISSEIAVHSGASDYRPINTIIKFA